MRIGEREEVNGNPESPGVREPEGPESSLNSTGLRVTGNTQGTAWDRSGLRDMDVHCAGGTSVEQVLRRKPYPRGWRKSRQMTVPRFSVYGPPLLG